MKKGDTWKEERGYLERRMGIPGKKKRNTWKEEQ